MNRHLVLRLSGPLMAFGDVAVDEIRKTDVLPGLSLLTGLLGNALGWSYGDVPRLDRLQRRLRAAFRLDRRGVPLRDFQTADQHRDAVTWSPRGVLERKSANQDAPALVTKHYRAGAAVTVVLRLEPPEESPTLEELALALERPARPLFLGRCCCPPAAPLFRGEWLEAAEPGEGVLLASPFPGLGMDAAPLLERPATAREIRLGRPEDGRGQVHARRDLRDFHMDMHAGTRHVVRWSPAVQEEAPA